MRARNKTILLVEDQAIVAMDEKQSLEEYDYRVLLAHSGRKAVETEASHHEVQLILMDIDLGDGVDSTETATEILRRRDMPIIFLYSHTEREVVEKTEGITSYGYVVKNSVPISTALSERTAVSTMSPGNADRGSPRTGRSVG